MSYVQLGNQNPVGSQSGNNTTSSGGPWDYNDGINWPRDTSTGANGGTPNFYINWNSNPPPSVQQIEQVYEQLVNWLKNNTGLPGFYNGSLLFLKMTVDIGLNLGKYSSADQEKLKDFLGNQISTGGDQLFLQMILSVAAQATAVQSDNGVDGLANATAFLKSVENATSGLGNIPPFNAICGEAVNELDGNPANDDYIGAWINGSADGRVKAHWGPVTNAAGNPIYTWLDDEGGANEWDPTITGQQPILNFDQFVDDAQLALGTAITASNNSSVNGSIDAYYQAEIQSMVAQFKGNPWALLAALMALINQRDQDNGASVNGYGGTLNTLQQANGYIQKMLGDISGTTPNVADFYAQLAQLKQLVLNDPALATVASQLEADIGTLNGNSNKFTQDINWTISKAGYYNFPPGSYVNGNPVQGLVYVPANTQCTIFVATGSPVTLTFGQMAAMGDYTDIQNIMTSWTTPSSGGSGSGTNWSSTVMSNFENGVTGIQTLLNSPSAGIQQQIQNVTQTMQAEENFEKEAFDSITNVNQQIMKLVGTVIG